VEKGDNPGLSGHCKEQASHTKFHSEIAGKKIGKNERTKGKPEGGRKMCCQSRLVRLLLVVLLSLYETKVKLNFCLNNFI
jgi:hypothetical protein